jgi:hypothetical protein
VCTCRVSSGIDEGYPGNCCTGFSLQGGCTQPATTPVKCTEGSAGVVHGSAWVVCHADSNSAWLSTATANGGVYDPVAACQSLGYDRVANWGGTGQNVCGAPVISGSNSCTAPGTESYGEVYDPHADYHVGGPGIIGQTVMWECVR